MATSFTCFAFGLSYFFSFWAETKSLSLSIEISHGIETNIDLEDHCLISIYEGSLGPFTHLKAVGDGIFLLEKFQYFLPNVSLPNPPVPSDISKYAGKLDTAVCRIYIVLGANLDNIVLQYLPAFSSSSLFHAPTTLFLMESESFKRLSILNQHSYAATSYGINRFNDFIFFCDFDIIKKTGRGNLNNPLHSTYYQLIAELIVEIFSFIIPLLQLFRSETASKVSIFILKWPRMETVLH